MRLVWDQIMNSCSRGWWEGFYNRNNPSLDFNLGELNDAMVIEDMIMTSMEDTIWISGDSATA